MYMNAKKYRMIYLTDIELANKIKEMRNEYHLNISSLIREFLDKKYQELKNKKHTNK